MQFRYTKYHDILQRLDFMKTLNIEPKMTTGFVYILTVLIEVTPGITSDWYLDLYEIKIKRSCPLPV